MATFRVTPPAGVAPAGLDLSLVHRALSAAGIGLDGVSLSGGALVVDAASDPSAALAGFDWAALVKAPALDDATRLDDVIDAVATALTGTTAEKKAAAAAVLALKGRRG